jgi:hypothetical protein
VPEAMRRLKRGRLKIFEMIENGSLEGIQLPGYTGSRVTVETLQKAETEAS